MVENRNDQLMIQGGAVLSFVSSVSPEQSIFNRWIPNKLRFIHLFKESCFSTRELSPKSAGRIA